LMGDGSFCELFANCGGDIESRIRGIWLGGPGIYFPTALALQF
jgi:hypothetical protein